MAITAWNYALKCWLCQKAVTIPAADGVNPDQAPAFIYARCPKCGAELNLIPGLLEPAPVSDRAAANSQIAIYSEMEPRASDWTARNAVQLRVNELKAKRPHLDSDDIAELEHLESVLANTAQPLPTQTDQQASTAVPDPNEPGTN